MAEYNRMKAERDALGEQLEYDRTKVAECITSAREAIGEREWLTEGRGSYEWDDDKWHDEFAAAIAELRAALDPLSKIAVDWSGCPKTYEAVAKARIDLKAALADVRAQLAEANT